MFTEKIINTQKRIIYKQMQKPDGLKSITKLVILQHLNKISKDAEILESIFILNLITGTQTSLRVTENKQKIEHVWNTLKLKKKDLAKFLLLAQLFLVPEINKNVVKLNYVKNLTDFIIKDLNLKHFWKIPSCYFNWRQLASLKFRLKENDSMYNYLRFINVL